jgi:hypothetical protein
VPVQPTYTFETDGAAVESAIANARSFLATAEYPLGTTLLDHLVDGAPAHNVIDALAAYQNPDGGFGNGLEVDIESPANNPFAARLAMTVLLALRDRPKSDLESTLDQWLIANQNADGDWHLSAETRAGILAPWFAAWTHPNLNPACCIAGLAARLDLGSREMFQRVATLFASRASVDEARTGDFYALLPYVEYVGGIAFPNRAAYIDALAENITANASGIYADAGHYWEHVLAAGPDLVSKLPSTQLDQMAAQLLTEQSDDGGWPSPYSPAWRPLVTASNASILLRLTAGIV